MNLVPFYLICFLAVGLHAGSFELSAHDSAWLAKHQVIRVAPDPDFPPIEQFDENGTFIGIAADYTALVEKNLGIRFHIVRYKTWDEILQKAKNREVDMLSAAGQTPGRSEYLLFSSPHIVLPGVIIVRTEVKKNLTINDLHGLKVSIVSGYIWQEFITNDHPEIKIDLVPDVQTGMKKVSFGMSDAFVENLATATHCIEKEKITNLRVAGETGYYTRLSFASRKDWPEFNSILEKCIQSILPEEKKAIHDKWIHLETSQYPNKKHLAIALAAIILIVTFFLLWNYSLQRQVKLRTEALQKSEKKFIEMVENANSIILRMDSQGNVTYFNHFAEVFFGFGKDEIIGKNVVGTIVPPTDTNGVDLAAAMNDLGAHPELYAVNENENMRKDGSRVYVSWSNKPLSDGSGAATELLSVGNDITELKRVQEALKSERDFAHAVFETAGALVAVFDIQGRIIRFNKTCEHITGYVFSEVVGRPFWDFLILPEETKMVSVRFSELKAGHFPNQGENYWLAKDGNRKLISWFNSAIVGQDNTVEYIVSTGIDITEKRHVEDELQRHHLHTEQLVQERTMELRKSLEKLEESEKRYRFLFQESPAGNLIIDTQGIIRDFNAYFQNQLGYSKEDVLGKPALDFIAPECKQRVYESLQKRFKGESIMERDNPVIAKDGSIHYLVFSGMQTLLYAGGNLSGILISGIDVTDRRNAEILAQKQQQQLIQFDKMSSLGILVSGVAHEINNPNNFIILNSDNLRDIWKDMKPRLDRLHETEGDFMLAGLPYSEVREEIEKLISGIMEGSRRIKTIVQHLKDFARQETGEMDQRVDVNAVIESSAVILSNLIKKTTDHYVTEFGKDLPPVRGNFQKIEQVVINLLTNACQALSDRAQSITVRTQYRSEDQTVSITVHDTGKGILPEHLKHIMDPFFTTKRDSGGTGLGLAISYGIIKDHHGEFTIRSEPGSGTLAEIILAAVQ